MAQIPIDDFKVDVDRRRVRHRSGVEFSYYRRWNDEDWIESGPAFVRNPALYDGDYRELFLWQRSPRFLTECNDSRKS
jgi:hypothetical protein